MNRTLYCCVVVAIFLGWTARCHAQETMAEINPAMQGPISIDLQRVSNSGLRLLNGKHITLYTDVPSSPWIDELPEVFDAAVPKWCEYFSEDVRRTRAWRMSAFLIRDKERFRKAGLIPKDLPEFPAGLNRGHEIWFFLQPDQYYTRHLMLHEGTHAFMQWFGNGVGAPWYAEGMAELLGLHRWTDGELTLHHQVSDPRESEGWGRPRLIKDWNEKNALLDQPQVKSLQDILLTPNRAFAEVENYAWCWAACEFLGQHPQTSKRFNRLQKEVHQRPEDFNQAFLKLYSPSLEQLERDWAWYIREMEYGYSVLRAAITELRPGQRSGEYELKTDRSWQMIRTPVKKGERYAIESRGRFRIGSSEVDGRIKPWPCESNGITIDYFRGRPIGELHATILPGDSNPQSMAYLYRQPPIVVGAQNVITANVNGLLCFRINESPANLADNQGTLKITIEKLD